jgi:hypothetical protein
VAEYASAASRLRQDKSNTKPPGLSTASNTSHETSPGSSESSPSQVAESQREVSAVSGHAAVAELVHEALDPFQFRAEITGMVEVGVLLLNLPTDLEDRGEHSVLISTCRDGIT